MISSNIVRAHCGLGANLGDAASTVLAAGAAIARLPGTRFVRLSSLYQTSPIGYADQPDFINAVLAIDTALDARSLLQSVKAIERDLGRVERPQWHQREIDIDILTYGNEALAWDDVAIPHPRAHERRFVLIPFAEIAPDVVMAGHSMTVLQLLALCADPGVVIKIEAGRLAREFHR